MLKLSLVFLILAVSCAVLRYMTEPAITAEQASKFYDMSTPLFFLFLALFAVSFLGGLLAKPPGIPAQTACTPKGVRKM